MNECIDPVKRNVETKSRILLEQINSCLDKEEKVEKIFNALYQCYNEIEKCYAEIKDKEALQVLTSKKLCVAKLLVDFEM